MKSTGLFTRMRYSSLFFKIASVVVASVLLASASISLISIAMSKNAFVDTFSRSNSKVLAQIMDNYSNLNDQIINVINRISESGEVEKYLSDPELTPAQLFSTIQRVQTYLKRIIPSNSFNDITILLAGLNGRTHVDNADVIDLDSKALLASDITKHALDNPRTVSYQFSEENYTGNPTYANSIIATKTLLSSNTRTPYGVIYIFLRPELVQNFYSHFTGNGNSVYMLDESGQVVSSSVRSAVGTVSPELLSISKLIKQEHYLYYNTDLGGQSIAVLSKPMSSYNFNLIGVIDKNSVLSEMYNTQEIILVALIITAATILFAFFIVRQTTKPISMLVRKMPMITNGNFDNYIPVTGSYEVRQLALAFNYMLDGLNTYMKQQMQMQNDKRMAEIHALQMQINPHFIYNTLSSIKWLMWQGEKDKSVQTIDAFIHLLQNTISNKNEMVTVSQEIENLKNYVLINQVRYGDHITVNFFILPGCDHYEVPKLLLQPIVENAFFHAFPDKSSGRIRVFVQEQNGQLICEVMDNGIGMDGGQVHNAFKQKGQHFTGIGIQNIDARMKLLYGEEYGVTITSEPHHGTTVRAILPAKLPPDPVQLKNKTHISNPNS